MKFFSEQARAAAAVARRRRAELKAQTHGELEVFAVRSANGYSWQLRKFGGVVLADSHQRFPSPAAARAAGVSAMVKLSITA